MKAPVTYQEWLDLLALLKKPGVHRAEVSEALSVGSFSGSGAMTAALERQMIDAVNAALDADAKRFIREMNNCIAFRELSQTVLLFKRLKKDVNAVLFFEKLEFLPADFREELSASVKKQTSDFWKETVDFLYGRSAECSDPDLEDALFLIRRIKLFE